MYTPVILCGGSGTRLWPLSRTAYPKQLLPLLAQKSLLQQCLLRLAHLPQAGEPIIICNQDHRFIVAEQIRALGISVAKIILEPEGKNTAPAVTLAALLREGQAEDSLLVLPADHVIQDHQSFAVAVEQASVLACHQYLVTFGVKPSRPETAYGYIQKGMPCGSDAFHVRQFVEKPDLAAAQQYLHAGDYFWNSGMFMFSAKTLLQEMARHAADIVQVCREAMQQMTADLDFYRIPQNIFSRCRAESIDYAAMEKAKNIVMVHLHADWSDVGSWDALAALQTADANGNVLLGDVMATQVKNSYLRAEGRLVAVVGVSDVIIVETADAVLVAHKNNCQQVKALVDALKKDRRPEAERHYRDYRPWGYYEVLNHAADFQAKRLWVKPGAKLSLQLHRHRSEHWVVIKGQALVTCGEQQYELTENQSTFIPAGQKHRLENNGKTPLELIEVQTGSYFGEDDILRFEDVYQRVVEV